MKNINKEIWRDIPGYKDYYQASNQGRIRSLDRWVIFKNGRKCFYKGRIFEGSFNLSGYKQVNLSRDGKAGNFFIHQLVAMAFLGHKPDGHTLVVDHINGVKADNSVENLQIVSQRNNSTTCYRKDKNSLTSDFAGVSYHKPTNKWRADIVFHNKRIFLGQFDNEIDASDAYQKALAKLENDTFNPDEYKPKWTSKYKGVTFNKRDKKWRSQVRVNKKYKHIGSFNTEVEAFNCVQKFKKIMEKENG